MSGTRRNPRWSALVFLSAFVLAGSLSGCAVGPNYREPSAVSVEPLNAADPHFSNVAPNVQWWKEFSDAELASLELRALDASPDIAIALSRVQGARASFTESEFNFAPHVTAEGNYSRSKEQYPGFGTDRLDIQSKSAGFDATWELDFFGHLRREAAAARANLEAERANFADAQVRLTGEVARNYFELRGTQRELEVARENIDNEREALRLTQIRYEAGRVTALDTDSAQARLKATEATVPLLGAAEKRSRYRLAVLLGLAPGMLDAELAPAAVQVMTAPLPIGDVTRLLRNRPDMRVSERQLAAATERVGVATADLFPRVTFEGFIGFLAGDGSQLGKVGSRAWSASPTVSWAALDYGSVRARLRASKADAEGALAAYKKTTLSVLEDFQNACANYSAQQGRLSDVVDGARASRSAADIAAIQYREGRINFLVLLDAQRTMLQAEDELARAESDANTAAVAVFKALGGVAAPDPQLSRN